MNTSKQGKLELVPPYDGYYPGEELARYKELSAELLSALKAALVKTWGNTSEIPEWHKQAIEAIAKAEGRANAS